MHESLTIYRMWHRIHSCPWTKFMYYTIGRLLFTGAVLPTTKSGLEIADIVCLFINLSICIRYKDKLTRWYVWGQVTNRTCWQRSPNLIDNCQIAYACYRCYGSHENRYNLPLFFHITMHSSFGIMHCYILFLFCSCCLHMQYNNVSPREKVLYLTC